MSKRNLVAILRARRSGAAVSLNNVILESSDVGERSIILHNALIRSSTIGACCIIGPGSSVFHAQIGSFSGIAERVTVGALPHPRDTPTMHFFPLIRDYGLYDGPPRVDSPRTLLGSDVWVGAGAILKSGIRVGHGAAIGAGAVVLNDVADYEIVAGVPARRVRMRFDDVLIARFLHLQWWEWPFEQLRDNIHLFHQPLTEKTMEALEEAGGGANREASITQD